MLLCFGLPINIVLQKFFAFRSGRFRCANALSIPVNGEPDLILQLLSLSARELGLGVFNSRLCNMFPALIFPAPGFEQKEEDGP